jgi:hypothetical protein
VARRVSRRIIWSGSVGNSDSDTCYFVHNMDWRTRVARYTLPGFPGLSCQTRSTMYRRPERPHIRVSAGTRGSIGAAIFVKECNVQKEKRAVIQKSVVFYAFVSWMRKERAIQFLLVMSASLIGQMGWPMRRFYTPHLLLQLHRSLCSTPVTCYTLFLPQVTRDADRVVLRGRGE